MTKTPRESLNLSRDRLRGAAEIAKFRGESLDRTRYLIRTGAIPTYKEGGVIVASKRVLIEHHLKSAGMSELERLAVEQAAKAGAEKAA